MCVVLQLQCATAHGQKTIAFAFLLICSNAQDSDTDTHDASESKNLMQVLQKDLHEEIECYRLYNKASYFFAFLFLLSLVIQKEVYVRCGW